MYDQRTARQQAARRGRLSGTISLALVVAAVAAVASTAGCQPQGGESEPIAAQPIAAQPIAAVAEADISANTGPNVDLGAPWTQQITWGGQPGQLTLRLPGYDQVATGPSALAVAPAGNLLVADRLAGRVVRVNDAGELREHTSIPNDVMTITAGPRGDMAALSPLRARVWVHDASGRLLGEVATPRALRELVGVQLTASRQLFAQNAYQELLPLGSPSAPLPLRTTLRGKQEGAALLPDGRGVATQVQGAKAELLLIAQRKGEHGRSAVELRLPLSEQASAARVIGVDGSVVCVRIEQVSGTPELTVTRRAICVESATGERLLDIALGRPGIYLPQQELAMGHGELAFMRPDADGLMLHRWALRQPTAAQAAAGAEVSP